jgi:solute carrier family 12 (potassium/chloride transporters), member 9
MPSPVRPQLRNPSHQHSNFQSRAATDDAGELDKRDSNITEEQDSPSREPENPYEPATNDSTPPPREHAFTKRLIRLHSHSDDGNNGSRNISRRRSVSGRRKPITGTMGLDSLTVQMHNEAESKKANGDSAAPRPGLGPRPIGGSEKLGMFSGVYVPTCLNVLSILMFLRFGFLLGMSAIRQYGRIHVRKPNQLAYKIT